MHGRARLVVNLSGNREGGFVARHRDSDKAPKSVIAVVLGWHSANCAKLGVGQREGAAKFDVAAKVFCRCHVHSPVPLLCGMGVI